MNIEELEKVFCFKSPVIKNDFHSILVKLFRFTDKDAEQNYFAPAIEYAKHDITIISRFAELEKKYENDTGDLIAKVASRDAMIDELEKEVENLKCCGNCCNYHFEKESHCYVNGNYDYDKSPSDYCDNWQSDNLTRKERET